MKSLLITTLLMTLVPTVSLAEDIEGTVKAVGSAHNAKIMLRNKESKQNSVVCMNETGKKLTRLSGLWIKVTGKWGEENKNDKCFVGESFSIVKMMSGRAAIVGTVAESANGFEIKDDNGKSWFLSKLPSNLKKMVGQKVIVDVKPMEHPGSQGSSYKVVTYIKFPD